MRDLTNFFTDSMYGQGPPLTTAMVDSAEETLGYKLPDELIQLLMHQNGGRPHRCCFPTDFVTAWGTGHFAIDDLLSIGGDRGMDSKYGSDYLIPEWGYPPVGVVFCTTPTGGYDAVMLSYEDVSVLGGPSVVYVGEDRVVHKLTDSVGEFFDGLRDCSEFEPEDED